VLGDLSRHCVDGSSWYVRSPPEEQITSHAVNRTSPQATPRFFATAPRLTERQIRALDQRRLPWKPPPDLTTLTKRYEGDFPTGYIGALLKFGRNHAAHGSEEMPFWGTRFQSLNPGNEATGQQHIDDVVAYIRSLQATRRQSIEH
jgi:hypothetical protein